MRAIGYGAAIRRPNMYEILIMRGDGGATPLEETGRVCSFSGTTPASHNTTYRKFIGGSYFIPGAAGSHVSIPDADDLDFGSNAFCIEMFVMWPTIPAKSTTVHFITHDGTLGERWQWRAKMGTTTQTGTRMTHSFNHDTNNSGTTVQQFITASTYFIPENGVWYHMAVSKDASGVWRYWHNGTQVGNTVTNTVPIPSCDSTVRLGMMRTISADIFGSAGGYMDEVRITVGIPKYTANFTPPTRRL